MLQSTREFILYALNFTMHFYKLSTGFKIIKKAFQIVFFGGGGGEKEIEKSFMRIMMLRNIHIY